MPLSAAWQTTARLKRRGARGHGRPDNVLRRLRRRKPSQRRQEPRNEHDELLAIFEMAVPPRWSCLCARRVIGNSRTDLAPEWTGSDEQGCTLLRQLLSAAQFS